MVLTELCHFNSGWAIYYHSDTTACTITDIVKLIFYLITTSVEALVPAGNQSIEALSKDILVKRLCPSRHLCCPDKFRLRGPNSLRVPSRDAATPPTHTAGTTVEFSGLCMVSHCRGAYQTIFPDEFTFLYKKESHFSPLYLCIHPLSAVHNFLFNISPPYLEAVSSIVNLRTRHAVVTSSPRDTASNIIIVSNYINN
jgi:hypothetical protein